MIKKSIAIIILFASAFRPATASPLAPTTNPCALVERMQEMHTKVIRIGNESYELAHTAEHIHHTSRWRPYRKVETQWSHVHGTIISTLIDLSKLSIALDTASEGKAKTASLNVVSAYQSALEHLTDYVTVAVYLERTENDLSNNVQPQYIGFGVSKMEVPTTYNSIAKNHFLAQFSTAENALHLLDISERHYGTFCPSFKSAFPSKRQYPS